MPQFEAQLYGPFLGNGLAPNDEAIQYLLRELFPPNFQAQNASVQTFTNLSNIPSPSVCKDPTLRGGDRRISAHIEVNPRRYITESNYGNNRRRFEIRLSCN